MGGKQRPRVYKSSAVATSCELLHRETLRPARPRDLPQSHADRTADDRGRGSVLSDQAGLFPSKLSRVGFSGSAFMIIWTQDGSLSAFYLKNFQGDILEQGNSF